MSLDIPFREGPGAVRPGLIKAGAEFHSPSWYVAVADARNCGSGPASDCWEVRVVDLNLAAPWKREAWARWSPRLSPRWRGVLAKWLLGEWRMGWPFSALDGWRVWRRP